MYDCLFVLSVLKVLKEESSRASAAPPPAVNGQTPTEEVVKRGESQPDLKKSG